MTESVADRMQLCKDRYNDIPQCLIDEVRALGLLVVKLEEKLDDIDTCELCEGEVEGCSICLECWNKLAPGAAELKAQLADYKYTPQAYDEMWERVKKTVNENDELKACITEFKAGIAENVELGENENETKAQIRR